MKPNSLLNHHLQLEFQLANRTRASLDYTRYTVNNLHHLLRHQHGSDLSSVSWRRYVHQRYQIQMPRATLVLVRAAGGAARVLSLFSPMLPPSPAYLHFRRLRFAVGLAGYLLSRANRCDCVYYRGGVNLRGGARGVDGLERDWRLIRSGKPGCG